MEQIFPGGIWARGPSGAPIRIDRGKPGEIAWIILKRLGEPGAFADGSEPVARRMPRFNKYVDVLNRVQQERGCPEQGPYNIGTPVTRSVRE
jgi:hypothetical protein